MCVGCYGLYTINFRLYTIRSTPQPVMCGVLGVSCMRYGVSDTNHLKATPMLMCVHTRTCYKLVMILFTVYLGIESGDERPSTISTTWMSSACLLPHDKLLVCMYSSVMCYPNLLLCCVGILRSPRGPRSPLSVRVWQRSLPHCSSGERRTASVILRPPSSELNWRQANCSTLNYNTHTCRIITEPYYT